MTHSYLMCYHESILSADEVIRWAAASPLVSHWRSDMPGCVYLLSEHTASELAKDFRAGGRGMFLIAEVGGGLAGTVLPETWALLTERRPGPHVAGRVNAGLQPAAAG